MMHLYSDSQHQYILLGAKQLYFNRFAADCNPMYICMQGFSKVVASPDSARKRACFLGMWKILARLRRAKIFHIPKRVHRGRTENRNTLTCEKPFICMIYTRGLDYSKEHSFKQVYFAPARESSLFMTHKVFTR